MHRLNLAVRTEISPISPHMLAAVMGVAAGVVVAAVVACEAVSAATVCTFFVGDPTPASL
jgi:hypothetical protein